MKLDPKFLKGRSQILFMFGSVEPRTVPGTIRLLLSICQTQQPRGTLISLSVFHPQCPPESNPIRELGESGLQVWFTLEDLEEGKRQLSYFTSYFIQGYKLGV